MYFQVCSNSIYPQHSGERYRTNGPLVHNLTTKIYTLTCPVPFAFATIQTSIIKGLTTCNVFAELLNVLVKKKIKIRNEIL